MLSDKCLAILRTLEDEFWAREEQDAERAVFDASGRIVRWEPCKSPEPIIFRSSNDNRERSPEPKDEAYVDADGRIMWGPKYVEFDPKQNPAEAKWLERWFALDAVGQEPFLTRAGRNIPEWDHDNSLEYGAYCLYVRNRHFPISHAQFRSVRGKLKARNASKLRMRKSRK